MKDVVTPSSPPSPDTLLTISAIIPTFNRADLLQETVDAVLGQSRAPDEILIVDDGSEDHTQAVIATFGDKVRLLSKPNSGKADSLNQAIAATSASHIWIVDDDDLPRPDALATLTKLISDNAGAEIAYGRHIRFSQDTPKAPKTYQETGYWDARGPEYFLIATLEDFFVHQPAMLVARALYERAGPFNTEMIASEDYEMLIRLASLGNAVQSDAIIFEQRVHAGVRGQKGHQFSAAERNAKWIEYDQRIFRAAFSKLPLTAYLPKGQSGAGEAAKTRHAQIQRACILARKKLWSLAISDLRAVATGDLQTPLDAAELTILRRGLSSKYGLDELFSAPDTVAQLRALASSNPLGRALVRGLGRGLVWHFRTALTGRHLPRALKLARLYLILR